MCGQRGAERGEDVTNRPRVRLRLAKRPRTGDASALTRTEDSDTALSRDLERGVRSKEVPWDGEPAVWRSSGDAFTRV